jgi:signal transduction histidine kinase
LFQGNFSSLKIFPDKLNFNPKDIFMKENKNDAASGKTVRGKQKKSVLKRRNKSKEASGKRMLALITLASGVAQDFNEILATIMGYVEMALLDSPKKSSIHRNLQHAMQAVERGNDLVTDLQIFSRQREQEHKKLQISVFIKDTLNRFRKSLPALIKMEEKITADTEYVNVNPTQIQQIVINLCTNACNAMLENGGTLKVSLTSVISDDENDRFNGDSKKGSFIKLMVSDTGKGIDREIRERIFDPYFTTTHTEPGYGMGLALVQSIVNALDGYIVVKSKADKGTVFTVYLPVDSVNAA